MYAITISLNGSSFVAGRHIKKSSHTAVRQTMNGYIYDFHGAVAIWRCRLITMRITIIKIRRSHDCLIFLIGNPYTWKDGRYIETGPRINSYTPHGVHHFIYKDKILHFQVSHLYVHWLHIWDYSLRLALILLMRIVTVFLRFRFKSSGQTYVYRKHYNTGCYIVRNTKRRNTGQNNKVFLKDLSNPKFN